jgi:PAS domain S-box-containing protein
MMDNEQIHTRETSDDLAGLFYSTQEMLAIVTVDGLFQRVNVAWENILGYGATELGNMSIYDVMFPDDLSLAAQKFDSAAKQKHRETFTSRCKTKSSATKWVRWSLCPAPTKPLVYVSACDISDQVAASDELARSNEILTSVLLSAPVPTWAVDMEGRVQFWNEAAEQTLGWTAEEVLSGAAPGFLSGSRVFDSRAQDSFAGKEVLWRRRDGLPRVLRIWTAPLHDGSGLQCGTLGMSVDVTPTITLGSDSVDNSNGGRCQS